MGGGGVPGVRGTAVLALVVLGAMAAGGVAEGASWCIARSGASAAALQTALDYACGLGGADCQPIQASGLCYLPNTLQSHASYAFNSYYQRHSMAPGSCDFAGTATVSVTDPSFGSCTYPSSPSTAGGVTPPPPPGYLPPPPPTTTTTVSPNFSGGTTPGFGPPTLDNSLTAALRLPPLSVYLLLLLLLLLRH